MIGIDMDRTDSGLF